MSLLFLIIIIFVIAIVSENNNKNSKNEPDEINLDKLNFNEFGEADKKKLEEKRKLLDLEYERAAVSRIMSDADVNNDGDLSSDEYSDASRKIEKLKRDIKTFRLLDSMEIKNNMSRESISIEALKENGNKIEVDLFKRWCKEIFKCIKINDNENIDIIEPFVSEEIFTSLKNQINRLDNDKLDFKSDDVGVKSVKIIDYGRSMEKETIKVLITATLKEYIINTDTKKVVKGSNKELREKKFVMTFLKKGNGLEEGFIQNCPNCQAAIQQTELGKCRYCGTFLFPIRYNWTLIKFEVA